MSKNSGVNRTGIEAHPIRTRNMLRGMEELSPPSPGDARLIGEVRAEAARHAPPLGSIPLVGKAGAAEALLMDKMGARLAFERNGVRLYDALLSKHDVYGGFQGGPIRQELDLIRGDELAHMKLLWDAIQGLGGDPTAVTPAANLQLTMGKGVGNVIVDARTSLVDSLEAILVAELADQESWETLILLAVDCGLEELASRFSAALAAESQHVRYVRAWLAAAYGIEPA